MVFGALWCLVALAHMKPCGYKQRAVSTQDKVLSQQPD